MVRERGCYLHMFTCSVFICREVAEVVDDALGRRYWLGIVAKYGIRKGREGGQRFMGKELKNRKGEKKGTERKRERRKCVKLVLGRRSGCLLREGIIVVDGRLRCRLTRRGEIRENKKYVRCPKIGRRGEKFMRGK